MRKLTVLIALFFVLSLIACGGGSNTPIVVTPPLPPSPPPSTASPDVRADYLVGQMTLDEKLSMIHGGAATDWWNHTLPHGAVGWNPAITRLGIPDLYMADGSVGVGNNVGQATALPSAIASAATFDTAQAYKYGQVIGAESRAFGINVNLGGNVNLSGREPRNGRTFETKGEDPILAGKINAAHINAIQDQFVLAGVKHFAMNDQETGRTTLNVTMDERSARESDLLAFEIGLKDSNVQSVMCSYNLINGSYGCENAYLLNTLLKSEWAFPGFVMTDWDAAHSTVAAANNGLDQEQPENLYFGSKLKDAVLAGQVPQSRIDNMTHRILRAMFAVGIFDHPTTITSINAAADAAVAQETAEQGSVLLKNDGTLPLNSATIKSIAIIGSHADIGVLSGGGSAQVIPVGGPVLVEPNNPCPPCWARAIWIPSSPMAAIAKLAPSATVKFNDGSDSVSAAALAASSDVAIVFVSQWESEAMDVPSLNFTDVLHATPIDQDALVFAVAAANPRTIVVMENGGPKVTPWLNNVAGVLESWYPGQKGGDAIANILFGVVNPSGKLPVTFPAKVSDLPRPVIATPPDATTPFNVDYGIDGFNVGYKWYEMKGITPLFPFGYGLSYTTFAITNAQIVISSAPASGFQVKYDLQNTGTRDGAEVAQVYLALPVALGESKRLVGWQKTSLTSGQPQSITITVNAADSSHPLAYWDPTAKTWMIAAGTYTVYLGNSSASATAIGTFQVP